MNQQVCEKLPASDPRIFGPAIWRALHILAEGYPIKATKGERRHCRRFLQSLGSLLPCSHCAEHFRRYLQTHDLHSGTKGRKELVSFLIGAHNQVSAHTRPAAEPWSSERAFAVYSHGVPSLPLAPIWGSEENAENDAIDHSPLLLSAGSLLAAARSFFLDPWKEAPASNRETTNFPIQNCDPGNLLSEKSGKLQQGRRGPSGSL